MSGWYPHCCIIHRHPEQCRGLQKQKSVLSFSRKCNWHEAINHWQNVYLISTSLLSTYIETYCLFPPRFVPQLKLWEHFCRNPLSVVLQKDKLTLGSVPRPPAEKLAWEGTPTDMHCLAANTHFTEPASQPKQGMKKIFLEFLISCLLPLFQL